MMSQGARVRGARRRGLSSRNRSGARVLQDEAASGVATDQWRLSGRTEAHTVSWGWGGGILGHKDNREKERNLGKGSN